MQVIETRDLIPAARFCYLHPHRPSLIICIKYIQLSPLNQSPTPIPSLRIKKIDLILKLVYTPNAMSGTRT
jgi:hypothetical protein